MARKKQPPTEDRGPNSRVDELVGALASPDATTNVFACLHELGHRGSPANEPTVAKYLCFPSDPMVSRMAIEVLTQWGVVERHRSRIEEYLRPIAWDPDDVVRQAAIYASGEILRSGSDASLLAHLLEIAENPAERELIREDSIRALARGHGQDWSEMPSASRREDVGSNWSSEVLRRARG